MLELIILQDIICVYNKDNEYTNFIDKNYDVDKIGDRYLELGIEFLNQYALNKTEKSDKTCSS